MPLKATMAEKPRDPDPFEKPRVHYPTAYAANSGDDGAKNQNTETRITYFTK